MKELLVGVEGGAGMDRVESRAATAAPVAVEITHRNEALRYFVAELPHGTDEETLAAVTEAIRAVAGVAYVEENGSLESA